MVSAGQYADELLRLSACSGVDGCADPLGADDRRFADRRGVRACVARCGSGPSHAVLEAAVFSVPVSGFVPTIVSAIESFAVSHAVRGAVRRDGNAFDAAVRRNRVCGRNDGRHGAAACRAAVRARGGVSAAAHSQAAAGSQTPFAAYRSDHPPEGAYGPIGCADRQRQSASGAAHRAAGDSDGSGGRLPDKTDSVCQTVGRRRSVRRAAGFGRSAAIRQRHGGLRLRAVAGTDRRSAGDSAGESFTN